jgi:hypothetical protein
MSWHVLCEGSTIRQSPDLLNSSQRLNDSFSESILNRNRLVDSQREEEEGQVTEDRNLCHFN